MHLNVLIHATWPGKNAYALVLCEIISSFTISSVQWQQQKKTKMEIKIHSFTYGKQKLKEICDWIWNNINICTFDVWTSVTNEIAKRRQQNVKIDELYLTSIVREVSSSSPGETKSETKTEITIKYQNAWIKLSKYKTKTKTQTYCTLLSLDDEYNLSIVCNLSTITNRQHKHQHLLQLNG